jgi:hypothetical protein
MMSSKNSGFTATDIDRYHSGKMSAEERHALEKAALDDPFLADALEGYALTSTPSEDLATIQSRLDQRLNKTRVVPFYQKYRWLAAAAVIVIIAGTAWLAFSISQKQNESVAVVNKNEKKPDDSSALTNPVMTNTRKEDSAGGIQNSTAAVPSATSQPFTPVNTAGAKKQSRVKNEEADKRIETGVATSLNSQSVAQNNVVSNNVISNNKRSRFAKVVPSAEPRANDAMAYKLNKTDTNKDVAASAPQNNVRPQSVIVNDTNVTIVMHPLPPDSLGLKEVVVSGYSTKKKAVANVYRPRIVIDTLEPEEGYDSFDDYVADNFNVPGEFKTKTGSGEVQLSFDVDRNGQPTNITVVKSLCQKCDEEAVRLLKEGPKWKKKKDKKGKLTITF